MVLRFFNETMGNPDCDDSDILKTFEVQPPPSGGDIKEDCPLCSHQFSGRYLLLRHLADCHFSKKFCSCFRRWK